jgi:hypothetical protein
MNKFDPGVHCGCTHLEGCHNIGLRAGKKVRTNCAHSVCGCREFHPKPPSQPWAAAAEVA